MDIKSETIDIKNSGDSSAMISYKIKSVRILDEVYEIADNEQIQDILAHEYPFHINMDLSRNFANAHDGTGNFVVSVSWPLDSGDDALDTEWGTKAYEFQSGEANKLKADENYQLEVLLKLELV